MDVVIIKGSNLIYHEGRFLHFNVDIIMFFFVARVVIFRIV
jgi:hypothetical protein